MEGSSRKFGRFVRKSAERAVVQARRELRKLSAKMAGTDIDLVFHTAYAPPDSHIVDAERSAKILGHLLTEGLTVGSRVLVPPALSVSELRRVHKDEYLESLDAPSAVARALGGDEPPPVEVAEGYLEAQRWATSGTVYATVRALQKRRLVVNLGGGFHHAERARGSGFCLFNDIAVAIEKVRQNGFFGRILVLDLDLHQGDGTRRIFANDSQVVAASVHATAWDEEPFENAIDMALGSGVGDTTYLAAVREVIDRGSARGEPALVIYVAGVDVAIDDTLGSWRVSHDAIFERDRLVIERFRDVPLVMVLAGGYGRDAWRHTARTLVWLLSGEDRPFSTQLDAELKALRKIARSLGEKELSGQRDRTDEFGITEADLMGDLVRNRPRSQLLGFYTAFGVELAFEKYGLIEHIRKRGYPRVRVELNLQAGSGEAITVYTDDARRLHLVELVVREMRDVAPYRLLSIEWLLLQDPNAKSSPDRPLLPGQDHPGLGALKIVIGMLAMAAERLRFDGLSFVPAHYHTAAQARGVLRFLNAEDEARFACIKEAVGAKSIGEISLLLNADGLVDDATGEVVKWKPAQMVMPISEALHATFGADYDRHVEEAARRTRFVLR